MLQSSEQFTGEVTGEKTHAGFPGGKRRASPNGTSDTVLVCGHSKERLLDLPMNFNSHLHLAIPQHPSADMGYTCRCTA